MIYVFLGGFIIYLFVLWPLNRAVIKKWGMVGKIWFDRMFCLAILLINMYYGGHIFFIIVLFGLLMYNMLRYNPWALRNLVRNSQITGPR